MRMAVLLSGTGRTLDNLHDRIADGTMQGSIEVVVANVVDALGLKKAKKYGYPVHYASTDDEINSILQDYDIELVLLAGFLKLYHPPEHLKHNVLNIHPALIPSFCGDGFYGIHVHRIVKKKGVKVSGCTVHFANEKYDEGPIVVQKSVPVYDEDSPDDIAERVFGAECEAYPEAINLVHDKGIESYWK
ncbi:MAG: phosphoribosylglycinamide formyltransferase [Proteobacteria bacterium]|nr:phosphoribosylglycinamide formyltransferase [Pseudomonadota bacterium]MBU1714308.1 phosphoribosylglycinamide formyltransferase [Pseudomonadota bacterium]